MLELKETLGYKLLSNFKRPAPAPNHEYTGVTYLRLSKSEVIGCFGLSRMFWFTALFWQF